MTDRILKFVHRKTLFGTMWIASLIAFSFFMTSWLPGFSHNVYVFSILAALVTPSFSALIVIGCTALADRKVISELSSRKTTLKILALILAEMISIYVVVIGWVLTALLLQKKGYLQNFYFIPRDMPVGEVVRLVYFFAILSLLLNLKRADLSSKRLFWRFKWLIVFLFAVFLGIRSIFLMDRSFQLDLVFHVLHAMCLSLLTLYFIAGFKLPPSTS